MDIGTAPQYNLHIKVPRGFSADVHAIGTYADSGHGNGYTGRLTPIGLLDTDLGRTGWTPEDATPASRRLAAAVGRAAEDLDAGRIAGQQEADRFVRGSRSWERGRALSPWDTLPRRGSILIEGFAPRPNGGLTVDMQLPLRSPAAREILALTSETTGNRMLARVPTLSGTIAAAVGAASLAGVAYAVARD